MLTDYPVLTGKYILGGLETSQRRKEINKGR
jgi:hypothetical protein